MPPVYDWWCRFSIDTEEFTDEEIEKVQKAMKGPLS